MDPELERYLAALVALLSLVVGFQATELWVSAGRAPLTFLVGPPVVVALVVGGVVWTLAAGAER
jgi:hypothetical protein